MSINQYDFSDFVIDPLEQITHSDEILPVAVRFLLSGMDAPDFEKVREQLSNEFNLILNITNQMGSITMFEFQGGTFTCNFIPAPMPADHFADEYLDDDSVRTLIDNHKSQAFVACSPMSSLLNTHILISILSLAIAESSGSLAICQDNSESVYSTDDFRSKLIPYLQEGKIPLEALLKIRSVQNESGTQAFTLGLRQFGLRDLEVVDQKVEAADVRDLLFSAADYSLANMIKFKKGASLEFKPLGRKVPLEKRRSINNEEENVMRIEFEKELS